MDKEEWLLMEYRNEPQASEEVLQFIADFLFHKNSNGKEYKKYYLRMIHRRENLTARQNTITIM